VKSHNFRGVAELRYEFIFIKFTSPLNPPKLGDFKLFFSPRIGGWGANHTFIQQRHFRKIFGAKSNIFTAHIVISHSQ